MVATIQGQPFGQMRIAALAMAGLAALSLEAQQLEKDTTDAAGSGPSDTAPVKLEKMLITGSSIKRVEGEGPAPVEIHTRKEIEQTGATSVNELSQYIPSLDRFDQGELNSSSQLGSGAAYMRMRGLGETDVLVLLNGRRLPVNALYDTTGAGAAVDINMIPVDAIERVEILKDGGSAIYGADAVAGVINFITKKQYSGLEAKLGYGQSSRGDGEEKSASVMGGFGSLDDNGYNVIMSISSFRRDPIYRRDREISSSADFRRFGGSDARSSFAPQGNYMRPPRYVTYTGRSVVPCPPSLYNGRCRYDFNADLRTAYNGADRLGALALGTLRLNPDIDAYIQLFHARSENTFELDPTVGFFDVPTGTGVIAGRFMQGGPRITDRDSKLDQFVLGLEGSAKAFDWDVAYSHGKSQVTNRNRNYFHPDLLNAFASGAIDPTATNNDPALVESFRIAPIRNGRSEIRTLDAKLSGEIIKLAGGALAYAIGTSIWNEKLVDQPDPLAQQGLIIGEPRQAAVDAKRSAKAFFAELNIPLRKNLELQAAVRRDIYSTAAETSPKIAASWKALPQLALRASYAESFRMPSLKQLYGAQEEGATDIFGADNCLALGLPPNCDVPALQVRGANPALKPEKGRTLNFGLVFDAARWLSGTLDYWKIRKTDSISIPTVDQAIAAGQFSQQGQIRVFTNLQNFARLETEGVDLDLDFRLGQTPLGRLNVNNLATYYLSNRRQNAPSAEWEDMLESYALPKWRNTLTVSLNRAPWSAALMWRYIGGFYDSDVHPTASNPRPAGTRRVESHDETDLLVSYTGFKNLKLAFGVKNLFDAEPPFSVQNTSNTAYTQMGFAELYTSRGRFYHVNLSYAFK